MLIAALDAALRMLYHNPMNSSHIGPRRGTGPRIHCLLPAALLAALALAPSIAYGQGSATVASPVLSDTLSAIQGSVAGEPTPTDPGFGEMTPERRAQAIEYSDTRNRFYFINTFYSFAVLVLLLFTGWSGRLRTWSERFGACKIRSWMLYFLFFSILVFVLDFPFEYYTGFALEHKYAHSNQTFGQWFWDLFKSEAIGYLLGTIVFGLLYLAIRRKGRRWWLWAGGFTAPLAAFFIVIAPVLIAPMFNTFSPLSDAGLRDKILKLASEAGIPDSRVFEVDASKQSNKYNAYVTGLFGSKRIVLYDTILKDMDDEEILFIMAHEIGHYVMHHIWIGVAGVTAFVLLVAWLIHRLATGLIARFQSRWGFSALSDYASFPLIALLFSLFGFLGQPATNALSRHFEHKSDEYGLAMTHDRQAARRAFEKLAAKNLSNPDPSPFIEFWLYDHPTIKDRVKYVLGDEGN